MKKTTVCYLLTIVVTLSALIADGQCSLQISSPDTCHLAPLTAYLTSASKAVEYAWKSGDNVVQISTRWNPTGVKVDSQHYVAGTNYSPYGLAFDTAHYLYVADEYGQVVQRYAPGSGTGVTVAGGNGFGEAADQLGSPTGIAIDKEGNIYIAELSNYRVSKWAPGAAEGVIVAGGNGYGDAANQLKSPVDVAVDDAGNIYVADFEGSRVSKWAPGATSGVIVAGGTGGGSNANQLNYPLGIFLDSARNLYIADSYNNRIQKWAPGAAEGVTVAGGSGAGFGVDQLNNPQGLTVTKAGIMYIIDYGNHRILRWQEGRKFGKTVAGGYGFNNDQFSSPGDIVMDDSDKQALYISDTRNGNGSVSKFTLTNVVSNTFNPPFAGLYTALVKTKDGCTAASADTLLINNAPFPQYITGPRNYHAGDLLTYTADSSSGLNNYYMWAVPSDAVIVSGQGTPVLQVKFGSSSTGYITVQASNTCGARTVSKQVFIINRATIITANLTAKMENEIVNPATLAPNPAKGFSMLTFSAAQTGIFTIQLTDAAGRKLKEWKGHTAEGLNKQPVDVRNLRTGIYFINLQVAVKKYVIRLYVQ